MTKRVSLHNPINIDFSGWIPLRDKPEVKPEVMEVAASGQPEMVSALDRHFLTVPVAVETDADRELSRDDLNAIGQQVLHSWNAHHKDARPALAADVAAALEPRPEVEELAPEVNERNESKEDSNETVFARAQNDTTFHAYFARADHVPPEGYVRLTRAEFRTLFRDADVLFV